MRVRTIYLLLLAAIFAGSCTTIQPRNVSDELYETPSREKQKVYVAQNEQMEDTSKDERSSRHYDIQRAPYWMYERYPYHPYYYDPFDFYYPYGLYPRFYSFYPYYGWGFSYYPYTSWYNYYWYGSWYSPYYNPYYYPHYGIVRNYQRKTTTLPSVPSHKPYPGHTQRYRKSPPVQIDRSAAPARKTIRQEPQRKYNALPERYIRATQSLRPINHNGGNRNYTPNNNLFQRKSTVRSFHQNIRRSTPVYRPPAKVRISSPARSSSSPGRKRR